MIEPVILDVESRSRVSLRAVGGRVYWRHPSSEALCCAWYDTAPGAPVRRGVWLPGQPWPHHDRVLAAHNWTGFDRFAAERYGFRYSGAVDTSNLARKAGFPGGLDALAGTKDRAASAFTRGLSTVRRPPKSAGAAYVSPAAWKALTDEERRARGVQPAITPAMLARVVAYCESDVDILVAHWPMLAEWLDVDAEAELVDAAVNGRGIAFDAELARLLRDLDRRTGEEVVAEVAAELSATPAEVRAASSSPAQFCAATGAPNAQALTVDALDHPLARARRALASIARGKFEAGLARVLDGRLHDTTRYYGAHTGRWSGQGMQLQNLPRPPKWLEGVDPDELVPILRAGHSPAAIAACVADGPADSRRAASDLVAWAVRATLVAPPGRVLVACDFAQIEGRALAWLAGDRAAVEVYTSGRDPYKTAAAGIYGCPYEAVTKPQRQIGKCAELALGYQGGPAAFAKIARGNRVDLSGLSDAEQQRIVDAWRALHRPIVEFWYACEGAFRAAAGGRSAWAGVFQFAPSTDGRHVACYLPSDRPIVYRDAHLTDEGKRKPAISYRTKRGREHIYGGKLAENAIQAYCRDLMADALVRVEAAGLCPVLTVHDEIVCEVAENAGPAALAQLSSEMQSVPTWAAGFPVGSSGWVGRHYRK